MQTKLPPSANRATTARAPATHPAKRKAAGVSHNHAAYWTQSDEVERPPSIIKRGFLALKHVFQRG